MKQTSKRLLSLIMALAMILSLVPMMAFAADTDTTIYLDPGVWETAGAWYDIWHWGNSSSGAWATAVDSDGDGVYEITVPADTTGLIILRKDPASSEHSWDCWNRQDLTYDGTSNCYTVTDWSTGSWGTYVYTEPEIAFAGGFNGWSSTANLVTAENGVASTTITLTEGSYEFKVIKNGTWLGCSTTIVDTTDGTVFSSSGGNCTLNASGGTYTFTFTASTNTLVITAELDETEVVAPEYSSPVVSGDSVTFNYWTSGDVTSAEVCGTMSSWTEGSGIAMTQDEATGIWSATVSGLYNGTYSYKLVINGNWFADPKNPNEKDSDGNSTFTITEGQEKPVVLRSMILHFQDTLNWGCAYAHFWNADDYNTTWPGTQMEADMDYPGWYTLTTTVSTETVSLIFSNGTGGEGYQTGDLSISEIPETDCEYWFVPTSADAWHEGTFETTAPETYVKEATATCEVTLHFKNTLAWDGVNGYAWTNTWPATYPTEGWPGTALSADENGWYTISFTAVYPTDDGAYAIFNTVTGMDDSGNTTYFQTADLYIDCAGQESVEKWIIPTGTQTEYLSYECDIYDAEPIETAQVNGVTYYTVAEAIANANGGVIKLLNDSYVALEIAADVTIDLAGHKLDEVTVADGYSLTLIDTAGDDYTSASCGVAYVKGTVNAFGGADGKNYLTILNSDGQYISHRYDVALTHISLDPANDALGYKAALYGDEIVQQYVTGFGFNLGVDGGSTKTYSKTGTQNLTLRLKNIMAAGGGEMNINASAFVTLTVGEESNTKTCDTQTTTMKETMQAVDAAWETAGYTEEQKAAVQALVTKYYDDMTDWNLTNIFPTIEIPIE